MSRNHFLSKLEINSNLLVAVQIDLIYSTIAIFVLYGVHGMMGIDGLSMGIDSLSVSH